MNQNSQKTKTLVLVALASSILSFIVHAYLTMNHFILKYGISSEKSFCNINSKFNCDVVATSKYAVFLKVPLAMWAAGTHLALSLVLGLWLIGLLADPQSILRISFWISSFILLMSTIMGTISAAFMSIFCLFCIIAYVLSIFIWISLLKANQTSILLHIRSDLKSIFLEQKWIGVLFILIPGFVYLGRSMILDSYGLDKLENVITEKVELWKISKVRSFNENSGLIYKKEKPGAPIKMTIVEFADYLCPHCKAAAKPLHDYTDSHDGVQLIFKPFPLDGTCNESGISKYDGIRCMLAYAVFCAEKKKKGWEVHDYIFEHQSNWNLSNFDQDLQTMSSSLSLDFNELKSCMNSTEIYTLVSNLAKEGAGISGTPTIFVNGKQLEGGQFPPILEEAGRSLLGE